MNRRFQAIADLLGLFGLIVSLAACAGHGAAESAPSRAAAPAAGGAAAPREMRGLWLRPAASPEAVIEQLDYIQRAGFNTIFVETFYHGFVIFPGGRVPLRPEMQGTDYLKLYLEEGHKRGLEVHAWIEVFYWEVDTTKYPQFPKTPLFDGRPEGWKARLRDGSTTEKAESAHIFANPAHPEVRALLAGMIEDMLRAYPLDGVNLDYIRYPIGGRGMDASYDEYSRKAFQAETGLDPLQLPIVAENADWQRWSIWREEQVLETVRLIKEARDRARPQARLSAAIFGDPATNRYLDARRQNWKAMVERGYLDDIIPMAYEESIEGILANVRNVQTVTRAHPRTRLAPVLAVQKRQRDEFTGARHPPVAEQVKALETIGVKDFSVFCYDWLFDSDEGEAIFKPLR